MLSFYPQNTTREFYTGTPDQPDSLHFFSKKSSKDKPVFRIMFPHASLAGYLPIISFSGTARIVNAVKSIFDELKQLKIRGLRACAPECWNALKNIGRGIAEIIPLTGVFLLSYDFIRSSVRIRRIEKEFLSRENVGGIAIDGGIICTFNLDDLDNFYADLSRKYNTRPISLDTNDKRLYAITSLYTKLIEKNALKQNRKKLRTLLSQNLFQNSVA